MIRKQGFLLITTCILSGYSKPAYIPATDSSTITATKSKIDFTGYQLVLQDDFNGGTLNTKTWDYFDENKIRGFGKMQRSDVKVSNGTLKLYATKTTTTLHDISFSSGMVSTQHSLNQRYGYFEIRAKLNSQVGPHAAFWLLQHSVGIVNKVPNPSLFGTEIDVFEYHCGAGTEYLYYGLHWNGYNFSDGSHRVITGQSYIPGIDKGFHKFALEWTPKEYIVYVDDIERARSSEAVSHIPEFVLLSMEISGNGGDRFKMSDATPDVFEVDYIKIYARKPAVTIYEKPDYYGWVSQPLLPGSYTTAQLAALGVINNQASSIEVPKGWKVIAYADDNFRGDSIVVTTDARSGGAFDNKLSSVKVTDHL